MFYFNYKSRRVLQIQYAEGYNNVGPIRWEISLCLVAVFTIVYFSLWKGVKSSGKVSITQRCSCLFKTVSDFNLTLITKFTLSMGLWRL